MPSHTVNNYIDVYGTGCESIDRSLYILYSLHRKCYYRNLQNYYNMLLVYY